MGSVNNLLSWIDDVCGAIPLVDLKHICTTFCELSSPLLFDPNAFTTKILTSTNGEPIIAHLAEVNAPLAYEIEATIAEFSVKQHPIRRGMTVPVDLTEGFRILGTPVGSSVFAKKFLTQQIAEVRKDVRAPKQGVSDLQTRL